MDKQAASAVSTALSQAGWKSQWQLEGRAKGIKQAYDDSNTKRAGV